MVLVGTVVFLARKPTSLTAPTVWAEDGRLFWADALQPGMDLWRPYAAEWWMSQRLLMGGLQSAPIPAMPLAIYVTAGAAAVLAVSVVLQGRARDIFGRFRFQALAFFLVLLIPAAFEVQGNLTNLQVWLGASLLVVLVLPAPRSTATKAVEIGYVVVAGLTGFLGVIMAPVALWWAVVARDRYVTLRSAVVLAAAAVNVAVWSTQLRPPAGGLADRLATVPAMIAKRLGGGSVLGEYPLKALWPQGAVSVWLIPSALFVLLLGYLAWRDRRGPSPVWLLGGLVWMLLAVVSPTGSGGTEWVFESSAHWRYFGLGIAAGFLVLVRALSREHVRIPALIGLIACVPALAVGYYLQPVGPEVTGESARAFEQCLQDAAPGPCELPIAPEGWVVVVPPE